MARVKFTKEDALLCLQERRSPFDLNMNGIPDAQEMIKQITIEGQQMMQLAAGTGESNNEYK
jgi:hypothetical protein